MNKFKLLALCLVCATLMCGDNHAGLTYGNSKNDISLETEEDNYTEKYTEGILFSLLNKIFHYCKRGALSYAETVDYTILNSRIYY